MKKIFFTFIVVFYLTLLFAQEKERTGWGWGGVPAINYNADEGFGYGVVGNVYNYAEGGYLTVQPRTIINKCLNFYFDVVILLITYILMKNDCY